MPYGNSSTVSRLIFILTGFLNHFSSTQPGVGILTAATVFPASVSQATCWFCRTGSLVGTSGKLSKGGSLSETTAGTALLPLIIWFQTLVSSSVSHIIFLLKSTMSWVFNGYWLKRDRIL